MFSVTIEMMVFAAVKDPEARDIFETVKRLHA
jgi:hypothetical protein